MNLSDSDHEANQNDDPKIIHALIAFHPPVIGRRTQQNSCIIFCCSCGCDVATRTRPSSYTQSNILFVLAAIYNSTAMA